jgi:hypothetical protein
MSEDGHESHPVPQKVTTPGSGTTRRNFIRASGALAATLVGGEAIAKVAGVFPPKGDAKTSIPPTELPQVSAEKLNDVNWFDQTMTARFKLDALPQLQSYLASLNGYTNDEQIDQHIDIQEFKDPGQTEPSATQLNPVTQPQNTFDNIQFSLTKYNPENQISLKGSQEVVAITINPLTGELRQSINSTETESEEANYNAEWKRTTINDTKVLEDLANKIIQGNHVWKPSSDDSAHEFGRLAILYAIEIEGDKRIESIIKGNGEIAIRTFDNNLRTKAILNHQTVPEYYPSNEKLPQREPLDEL